MNLRQSILLSLAIGFFVIAVHQTFFYPIAATYWLFMITAALMFLYYSDRKKQKAKVMQQPEKELTAKVKENRRLRRSRNK
jgi:4-hydroxybenzoate polyprenyltransferase